MNRNDIIRMARVAGLNPIYSACDEPDVSYAYEDWDEELEKFAALVAAAERERFGDECIDIVARWGGSVEIEAAIRARKD